MVPLARLSDIPDGCSRGFDPDGVGRDSLFVVRQGEQVYGWLDRCPHEGMTPLPYKRHRYMNAAGTRIVCFAHGAQFDIATGLCFRGPCLGESLTRVALSISSDGYVVADLPPPSLAEGL